MPIQKISCLQCANSGKFWKNVAKKTLFRQVESIFLPDVEEESADLDSLWKQAEGRRAESKVLRWGETKNAAILIF